jgi:hypothetical protein
MSSEPESNAQCCSPDPPHRRPHTLHFLIFLTRSLHPRTSSQLRRRSPFLRSPPSRTQDTTWVHDAPGGQARPRPSCLAPVRVHQLLRSVRAPPGRNRSRHSLRLYPPPPDRRRLLRPPAPTPAPKCSRGGLARLQLKRPHEVAAAGHSPLPSLLSQRRKDRAPMSRFVFILFFDKGRVTQAPRLC